MKHRLIGWLVALALIMVVLSCAMAAPDSLADTPTEGVLRATLSNGLRVVIVPNRLAPVVATELTYLVGSNDAPEGFPGTAHALEHMMFRGSAGLDKDQFAVLGALLGGSHNAVTSETVTQYTYTVPADDLAVALRSEALRMHALSLNETDWALERGAIEQEVSRDLSSPFYTYLSQVQAILYQGTPYEHDALGTRASFDRTDTAMLRQFYERWYAPNNAVLVIVGDVQPAKVLAEVQTAFGDIPARILPGHASFAINPVLPKTLELTTNFPVGLVTFAYRMPGLKSPDFAAADILGDVLASQRGALYGLVPAGRALMTRFSYNPKPDVGFGLVFAAFPAGGDPAPVLADLRRIMADTIRDGVPPELVAAAKRHELAQLAFQNDSIRGLASRWSHALTLAGAGSPDDIAHAYEAVTVADVNRLARLLLDPDHAVTAILTPQDSGQPVAGASFGNPESFGSSPDHPVDLPPWTAPALTALPPLVPVEPPDVSVLPNGLRLIVQPEHVGHTVSVYGHIRSVIETQELPGKEGVATLAGILFVYGTEIRDRLAFREAIDTIAADESAGTSFHLQVLTPHFEQGMRLLAENELHPAFPPEAFAVIRKQTAQRLAGALQSPDHLFQRAVTRAVVPDGDPTLRQGTPETVMGVQLADLRDYYAAAFRPDLTTIIVLGDVTVAEARRVVSETFGGWRADGPAPAIDLPAIGASPPSQARVPDASSLQDSVALAEAITLPVGSPDRYTLILGNTILGNGFASRLYRDLRIRTGYVYSVSSQLHWTRTRAHYSVFFGADPDNIEKARLLVLSDLREMQTTPVSNAELIRAKAQMLRQLRMQRSSVGSIASLYLRLDELGLPLNAPEIAARRYEAVTAPDIQRAFRTWLRPDDLATVVKGPAAMR